MTKAIKSPAFDPASVTERSGTGYPPAHAAAVQGRSKRLLGDAAGLTQFGVNLVRLEAGAWSSQRHWHAHEDEFVYILEGEATLVTDAGEQVLGPGMAAGFKAGSTDGHHLINRTARPLLYLEVGTRAESDQVLYSDIDMKAVKVDGKWRYSREDGTSFNGA